MKRISARSLALPATALFALLAVAGCKKPEPAAPEATTPPPVATLAAPPPSVLTTPVPAPPSMAPAGVTGIVLGSVAGTDMKITTPKSTFSPKDKIIVAVTTRTRDATATVPATLAAKWTHVDSNQTVNEESREVQLKGEQLFDFEITNNDPWPAGKYRVDVLLDGDVVSSRGFEVK